MKKKKMISALCMCITLLFANTNAVFAEELPNDYTSVIQNTIQKIQTTYQWASETSGHGSLYDLDQNGTEELIMLYPISLDNRPSAIVYSVYTISEGSAMPLLEEETLLIMVGGADGSLYVVEKNEQLYFAAFSETYEFTADGCIREGFWNLYDINGTEVQTKTRADFVSIDQTVDGQFQTMPDEGSYIIDGNSCSYQEYKEWVDSMQILSSISLEESEDMMTLQSLAEYIRIHSDAQSDPAQTTEWSKLYYNFIINDRQNADDQENWDTVNYEIIYLDEDSIPELWIDYQYEASGCRLVWCSNGEISAPLLGAGYLSYKESENLFVYSSGKQGAYSDHIYSFVEGNLYEMSSGSYETYTPQYKWMNQIVSEETYFSYINEITQAPNAKSTSSQNSTFYTYEEILNLLNSFTK